MNQRRNFKEKSNQENFNFENLKNTQITVQRAKVLVQKLDVLKKSITNEIQKNYKNTKFQNNKENIMKQQKNTINGYLNDKKYSSNKIQTIRLNIIGLNTEYTSPFNIKLETVYIDHTATSRPYRQIQNLISNAKRFIANPHTEFSHFGKYSTQLMQYSEKSLLKTFNTDPQFYIALPIGNGATGAIEKAIKLLKMIQNQNKKPQIFLTPYEHHSNILPWVQFYDKITVLAHNNQDVLVMDKIQTQIRHCANDQIIFTVSAASNVTSQQTDLKSLNNLIKKFRKQLDKKLIFAVDCAAYCCHFALDLSQLSQIDFVFLSPHKNIGGAQSCGVLVAKKSVIKSQKPTFPGGGTVVFVKGYSKQDVIYESDVFYRQIPGTPPFLGFYRAALSYQLLKNQIGYDFIHKREKQNTFFKIFTDQKQLDQVHFKTPIEKLFKNIRIKLKVYLIKKSISYCNLWNNRFYSESKCYNIQYNK